jgi:dipeptide/tripeptide permease
MDEKIQAIEQRNDFDNSRWHFFVVMLSNALLKELLLEWLPKPWAASLAWVVVCGVYIIILYSTKPKFRTHRRRLLLMLTAWIGGAIVFYVISLQPDQRYPLWISGVFWGLVTSLLVWAYVKRKQNRHATQR